MTTLLVAMQKSISENKHHMKLEAADKHTGWLFYQLRTGNEETVHTGSGKFRKQKNL